MKRAAIRRPAIPVATHKLASAAQIAGSLRNDLDAGFARAPQKYPPGVRWPPSSPATR
jgi:hypothetical protein